MKIFFVLVLYCIEIWNFCPKHYVSFKIIYTWVYEGALIAGWKWQYFISISKAPGALITGNTVYWQFCYRYPPLVSPGSCIQGRRRGEIVYDWFRNYLDAHRDFPEDSLVSMIHVNDWQHSYAHGLYLADRPTVELLQSMKLKGDLENAILIFLSDHGCKIGDYPKT